MLGVQICIAAVGQNPKMGFEVVGTIQNGLSSEKSEESKIGVSKVNWLTFFFNMVKYC